MLGNQRGGVLVLLLVLVSLLGIGLLVAGQSWKDQAQREREIELLWRGEQYRLAIQSYYQQQAAGVQGQFPASLEELIEDRRGPQVRKHIRQLFPDPMTQQPFAPVKGPDGRVRGVRSDSLLKPFKTDGFTEHQQGFELASSYSEWAFVYRPPRAKPPVLSTQKTPKQIVEGLGIPSPSKE